MIFEVCVVKLARFLLLLILLVFYIGRLFTYEFQTKMIQFIIKQPAFEPNFVFIL